jgi:XTP/dITP diphosphohydrolase
MLKLVLASKNLGKIAEFERMLGQHATSVKVLGLNDFPDMPDVEESGKSLSENARLKAQAIAKFTNLPALADDSGLFIDALNADPGVLSARWAGYQGVNSQERDRANIQKVLAQLEGVPKPERGAQFKSVVTYCDLRDQLQMIEKEELGVLDGEILLEPIGDGGFGYDPIFMPTGFDKSLAQLPPGVKDEVSHRGIAFRAIIAFIKSNL